MDNFNKLLFKFNFIYNDYKINKNNYDLQVNNRPNGQNYYEIRHDINGPPPNGVIDNILTNAITTHFLKDKETILEIINLYSMIYEKFIAMYTTDNYIYNNRIVFTLKGGLSMLLTVNRYVYEMPLKLGDVFLKDFVNDVITKSDIDFGLIINYDNLSLENQNKLFNDMYNMSFIILYIVREYITTNKYKFSDFEKSKPEYQQSILKNIREKINNKLNLTHNKFCKININDINEEDPCPNDVEYYNSFSYDKLIVHSNANYNEMYIINPQKIGLLNFDKQYNYILSSNIVEWTDSRNKIIKFGLVRMKIFFNLYNNIDANNCCENAKHSGELIDISIPHPSYKTNYTISDFKKYKIDNFNITMPILDHHYNDLYYMLYKIVRFPWDINKYEKRLKRYFTLSIIQLLLKSNQGNAITELRNIQAFFERTNEYLGNYNNNFTYTNNLFLNGGLNADMSTITMCSIFDDILTLINGTKNKITQNDYDNNVNNIKDNLNIFINLLKTNIKNIINFIGLYIGQLSTPRALYNSNNLTNNVGLLGGKKMIGGSKNSTILNKLINMTSNFKNIILTEESFRIFYKCYEYLIPLFLDNTSKNQIFIDVTGKEIYNSANDPNINVYNCFGQRKKLNGDNIIPYMFLNFLVEYHTFLIYYMGMNFNTKSLDVDRNYKSNINWSGGSRNYGNIIERYKDELLNKNIDTMLTDFNTELNMIYYRFIITLIKNLTTIVIDGQSYSCDIEEIKSTIFGLNDYKIDHSDKYDYLNYLYHDWKIRLSHFMKNKYNVLLTKYNEIIRYINSIIYDTINHILSQNGTNQLNELYNTNLTGLFSYIYFYEDYGNYINKNRKIGCCINTTTMEIYLLLKIHEDNSQVGFAIEVPNTVNHRIWTISQREMQKNMSHWCGTWLSSFKDTTSNVSVIRINTFRNIYSNNTRYMIYDYSTTNLTNNGNNIDTAILASKKNLLKSFIYLPIDMKIEYLRQNANIINAANATYNNVLKNTLLENLAAELKRIIN